MSHVSAAEEQTRTAHEAGFATIGRAIADRAARGDEINGLVEEAARRRKYEQESADRLTQFAGLARQIGDAANSGNDLQQTIQRLVELRRRELGPDPNKQRS
jgi:hypothetical protein